MRKKRLPADGAPLLLKATRGAIVAAFGLPIKGSFGPRFTQVTPVKGGYAVDAVCECNSCNTAHESRSSPIPRRWPKKVSIRGYTAYVHNGTLHVGCQWLPVTEAGATVAASDRIVRASKGDRGALARRLMQRMEITGLGVDGEVYRGGYALQRREVLEVKHLLANEKLHGL